MLRLPDNYGWRRYNFDGEDQRLLPASHGRKQNQHRRHQVQKWRQQYSSGLEYQLEYGSSRCVSIELTTPLKKNHHLIKGRLQQTSPFVLLVSIKTSKVTVQFWREQNNSEIIQNYPHTFLTCFQIGLEKVGHIFGHCRQCILIMVGRLSWTSCYK